MDWVFYKHVHPAFQIVTKSQARLIIIHCWNCWVKNEGDEKEKSKETTNSQSPKKQWCVILYIFQSWLVLVSLICTIYCLHSSNSLSHYKLILTLLLTTIQWSAFWMRTLIELYGEHWKYKYTNLWNGFPILWRHSESQDLNWKLTAKLVNSLKYVY